MNTKDVIRYTRTGLTAAAVVFSIISLISEKKKTGSLIFALLCVSISNLLSDIEYSVCDDECDESDCVCDCGCCDEE